MADVAWHPYAPDQDFGVRLAADHDLLDRVLTQLDAGRRPAPRPANKAPMTFRRDPWHPPFGWPPLPAGFVDPITTATALEAAPDAGVARVQR